MSIKKIIAGVVSAAIAASAFSSFAVGAEDNIPEVNTTSISDSADVNASSELSDDSLTENTSDNKAEDISDISNDEPEDISDATEYQDTQLTDESSSESEAVDSTQSQEPEIEASSKNIHFIPQCDITLSQREYVYDGTNKYPSASVSYRGTPLKEGTDYTISYVSSKSIGMGRVVVTGMGEYVGPKTRNFSINPAKQSITSLKGGDKSIALSWNSVSASGYVYYDVCYAANSSFSDAKTITISDKSTSKTITDLSNNKTYYVKVRTRVRMGKDFTGAWSDTKTVSTNTVSTPANLTFSSYSSSSNSITLKWSKVSDATNYRIYRKSSSGWQRLTTTSSSTTSYTNSSLSAATDYEYTIRAVKVVGSTEYLSPNYYSYYTATAPVGMSKPIVSATTDTATLEWSKIACTGYEIYDSGNGFVEKLITSSSTTTYTLNDVSSGWWYNLFKIRAYKADKNGKKVYGSYSSEVGVSACGTGNGRLNKPTLSPHTTYNVYNAQGETQTKYTITLTSADITTLKNFANKYFKAGMTNEQKVQTTLEWINKNVTYARDDNWNKIVNKTWVDAIFNYRLGQCAQYNGALIGMMAYMGYDVCVIQGLRGTGKDYNWPHFWGEVKVDGKTYVMECGNFGEDQNWMYTCEPYSVDGMYLKCFKVCN